MSKTYSKADLVRYAYVVTRYELLKFRFDRETNIDVKIILKQELDDAYEKLNTVRESLEL